MTRRSITWVLLALAASGCAANRPSSAGIAPMIGPDGRTPAGTSDPNAWQHLGAGTPREVACGELPVLVEESRGRLHLSGSCGYVRIAGDHMDVVVDLVPGGTIEITGTHNDVSWRQVSAGAHPSLYNRGASNSFHPPA